MADENNANKITFMVETELRKCMDSDYIGTIMQDILEDVINNVEVTSDYPNYNDSDVRLAIGRTLEDRILALQNIKDYALTIMDSNDKQLSFVGKQLMELME